LNFPILNVLVEGSPFGFVQVPILVDIVLLDQLRWRGPHRSSPPGTLGREVPSFAVVTNCSPLVLVQLTVLIHVILVE
jgi:hypothetical protein